MRSLLVLLLILASSAVLIGVLGKVQHWPGADLILGAGLISELLCAVLLVFYFWKKRPR